MIIAHSTGGKCATDQYYHILLSCKLYIHFVISEIIGIMVRRVLHL